MIQIRDVLNVKFGKIDQAVELFTRPAVPAPAILVPGRQLEVLTDVSGVMYTMVNEYLVDNLAEYEELRLGQLRAAEFDAWFRQFQLFVEGGERQVYNVEGNYESWSAGNLVVRESYRAYKWQIEQAVGLMKRYGGLMEFFGVGRNCRILTDASGPMFRAIIEIETDSLSAWESKRRDLYKEVEFQVWFNQMLPAVEAGSHEFFRVEYSAEEALP